jgi:hypothetical protein
MSGQSRKSPLSLTTSFSHARLLADLSHVSYDHAHTYTFKPDVQLIEFQLTKRAYHVTTNQGQEMLKQDIIFGSRY